ncbi:MAG: hypothetical protein RL164_769 [Bacteroidota bacterium]
MKIFTILYLCSLLPFSKVFSQDTIKIWQIPPYEVQLVSYENIREDVGIRIDQQGKVKSYYQAFEISKNEINFQLSGHIRVNKDSTELKFIELENPRKTEGILGLDVTINLKNKTVVNTPISKPKWLWQATDSAFIVRLSDDSTQLLHRKMTDGIQLVGRDNTMNLRYKYIPTEWRAPNTPNFKVILYQNNDRHEILLFSNYYILDGYVYSTGGSSLAQANGFGEGFWNANIKLVSGVKDKEIEQH